jgi:hypothetical protein
MAIKQRSLDLNTECVVTHLCEVSINFFDNVYNIQEQRENTV